MSPNSQELAAGKNLHNLQITKVTNIAYEAIRMSAPAHDEEIASQETDSLLSRGRERVHHFWQGFIDFVFQGHILQIAFGLM